MITLVENPNVPTHDDVQRAVNTIASELDAGRLDPDSIYGEAVLVLARLGSAACAPAPEEEPETIAESIVPLVHLAACVATGHALLLPSAPGSSLRYPPPFGYEPPGARTVAQLREDLTRARRLLAAACEVLHVAELDTPIGPKGAA